MGDFRKKKKRVIVIGAGIAGLAFGLQLLTHASDFYEVVIFERSDHLADIHTSGFAFALSPNSLSILKELDIDLVEEGIGMPLNNIVLRHSSRPEEYIAYCPNVFPDPYTILWVDRGLLQSLLLERFLTLGGYVQYDCTLVDIETHIDGTLIAKLSSGNVCNGYYIIGADGANSRVRKYLYTVSPPKNSPSSSPLMGWMPFSLVCTALSFLGKIVGRHQYEAWEVSPTPWTALYGITKPLPEHLLSGGEHGKDPVGYMHWYLRDVPGAYCTYSLSGGRVFWVCYQQEPHKTGPYTKTEAEATMNMYSDAPYSTVLPVGLADDPIEYEKYCKAKTTYFGEITSHSERIMKVRLSHTFFPEISNKEKNIVLIGDAAHTMNTFNGQGAGIGIEEGLVLCNALLRSEWAIKRGRRVPLDMMGIRYFEKQRLTRSERVTNFGWWTAVGLMGNHWWLRKLRDTMLADLLATPTPEELWKKKVAAANKAERDFLGRRKEESPRTPKNWLFDHHIYPELETGFWELVQAAARSSK